MKVYDEAWGSLDVISYTDLVPVVAELRSIVNFESDEALRTAVSDAIAPLEALLNRKE